MSDENIQDPEPTQAPVVETASESEGSVPSAQGDGDQGGTAAE